MGNMSYCRFENTVTDMYDCLNAIRDARSIEELIKDASEYEVIAIENFFRLCKQGVELGKLLDYKY